MRCLSTPPTPTLGTSVAVTVISNSGFSGVAYILCHHELRLYWAQCSNFSSRWCQTPIQETNWQRHVGLFKCPFVGCVYQARPSYKGDEARCFTEILGGRVKIRDQPINTRNLASWLSGKSFKLLPPHVKFQCQNAPNSIPGVCSFVSLVEFDTYWTL